MRFPPYVAEILHYAGWYEGRDEEIAHLARNFTLFPAAEKALREFGGLGFQAPGKGLEVSKCDILFHPDQGLDPESLGRPPDGSALYPLAKIEGGQAHLLIGERGQVYLFCDELEDFAASVDRAIVMIALGLRQDRANSDIELPANWPPPEKAMVYRDSVWRSVTILLREGDTETREAKSRRWIVGAILLLLFLAPFTPLPPYQATVDGLPFVHSADGIDPVAIRSDGLYLVDDPQPGKMSKFASPVLDSRGREAWQSKYGSDLYSFHYFAWGVLLEIRDGVSGEVTRRALGYRKF